MKSSNTLKIDTSSNLTTPTKSPTGSDTSIGDLDALQSDLYGHPYRSNTPSPNLSLDLDGISLSGGRSISSGSKSERSSGSDEDRVNRKRGEVKIGLVGLDKLLAKTPRTPRTGRKDNDVESKPDATDSALYSFFVEKCKLTSEKASQFTSKLKEEEIILVEDLLELLNDNESEFKQVLKEAGCKRVHVARIKNQVDLMAKPNVLLQQWMSFSIPLPEETGKTVEKERKMEKDKRERQRKEELKELSKESEASNGSSNGSSGGWMESPRTSSRASVISVSSDEKDRMQCEREKYRDYSDDSSFDSDASYETDTDSDSYDSSEDSTSTNSSTDLPVSTSTGGKQFKPPPGPPPSRKNVKPPSKPPIKAVAQKAGPKKSLLEAARSRMTDPKLVHGDGVRKFI
ncbi:hypothetical protein TL16_g11522 [Triparma laevis f. inornata]|uniref:Uncharacterized protein n=1 Tax=Triparma laevis f. inornata TaxID=1714386 RepID=A0A9W7BJI3_9STRA|nr:hypothetical protein TL16_g11522 [Triparma laevis f. inornata]